MADPPPVLVAPDTFGGDLRAPVVAAAVARGLERAGVMPPPELCPVSSGGAGTIEALLPALGGETGEGFALVEAGGTVIVERDPSAQLTAERLRDEAGARLVAGGPFVLEALGFDARLRAARAVVVGAGRLERATLRGPVAGEIATRARQSGVPCHAVTAANAIDRFDARILDLQAIVEGTTVPELEAAGEAIAAYL